MPPSRNILLVEDNPDDEELTLLAFKENNILNDIPVARDGAEALAMLFGDEARDPIPLPSIVLLDLKLPKVDGLEVLRRVRADARTKRVPVIVLTSSNTEADLIASYELGCNSYVRKPVDFTAFVDAARQLGSYWLLLNETPPEP